MTRASAHTDPSAGSDDPTTSRRAITAPPPKQRRAFVPVHPTPCGKYTLIAKIGHGGMAEVFLGVASGLAGFRKLAVVKRIHPQLLEEPDFVQMFLDEARLAARLSHPNVVQTHEVDEHDGVPFIAMDYMEGLPYDKLLKDLRRRHTQLPVKTAVRIAIEALAGLHYAHELRDYDGSPLKVVHRDISPSNIFVTYQGVVRILDFGIAKATTQLSETRTGQIKGKLSYMAPEQARGKGVDRRADVWSIGVTLFETCTGERLFRGESDVDTLQRVLTGDIYALIRSEGANAPEPLVPILKKALERKKEDRYADADEMRKALLDVLPALPGPDLDVPAFVAEHCAQAAEEQRALIGELLETAERRQSTRPPAAAPSSSTPPDAAESVDVDVQVVRPPSRTRQLAPALLLLGTAMAAGLGLALWETPASDVAPAAGAAPQPESEPEAPRGAAPDPSRQLEAEPEAPRGAAPDPSPQLEAEPAADLEEAPVEETDPSPDEADLAAPAEDPEVVAAEEAAPAGRRLRRRPRVARPTAPSTDEAAAPPPAAPSAEHGMLRLVTQPWSEVYLNGRRIGTTPLIDQRLPAGTHSLLLRNPEENIEQRLSVEIPAGGTARLNVGLR